MPRAAKKTSRTSTRPGAKKSGAKAGTARKRTPASSTGGRRGTAKSPATKGKGSRSGSAMKSRGVRAARGRRPDGDTLSKPLQYAKLIHSPEEHEDRHGQSLATRNHDVIRQWAEERQAVPSKVESTEREDSAGVLRLNFPGYGGERLQEISWDDWFGTFDERKLVFLYQEHKTDGSVSNFFRLNRSED